jgi:hypothetical protein
MTSMGKLFAMAVPVLPGKTEQWKSFMSELRGKRLNEYIDSRNRLDVRERTFLQNSPQGDMVIVTLEGNDPAGSFKKFIQQKDEFAKWFIRNVQDIHGIDFSKQQDMHMPEMLIDSAGISRAASEL